jgi:hypothetical protein
VGIFVLVDGSDLPADQLTSADDAIYQVLSTLNAAASVLAGDYIATGRGPDGALRVQRATEPLRTAYTFSRNGSTLGSCASFSCAGSPLLAPFDIHVWSLGVLVAPDLRLSTTSGTAVGEASWSLTVPHLMALVLAYDPSVGWHLVDSTSFLDSSSAPTLAQPLDAISCAMGSDALRTALGAQAGSYGSGEQLNRVVRMVALTSDVPPLGHRRAS